MFAVCWRHARLLRRRSQHAPRRRLQRRHTDIPSQRNMDVVLWRNASKYRGVRQRCRRKLRWLSTVMLWQFQVGRSLRRRRRRVRTQRCRSTRFLGRFDHHGHVHKHRGFWKWIGRVFEWSRHLLGAPRPRWKATLDSVFARQGRSVRDLSDGESKYESHLRNGLFSGQIHV